MDELELDFILNNCLDQFETTNNTQNDDADNDVLTASNIPNEFIEDNIKNAININDLYPFIEQLMSLHELQDKYKSDKALKTIFQEIANPLVDNEQHLNVEKNNMLKLNESALQTNNVNDCSYLLSASSIRETKQCEHTVSECAAIHRIRVILNRYKAYIFSRKQNNSNDADSLKNIEMHIFGEYGAFSRSPQGYDITDLLNDFNHSKQAHYAQFEDIYNKLTPCNLEKCLLIRRNQRDRVKCNSKHTLKQLYFCTDNEVVVFQELLDRIHCFYCHSFDTGYKIKENDRENILKQEVKMDENDIDPLLYDNIVSKISRWSQRKKNKYSKVSGLERIYNVKNKFVDPNEKQKTNNVRTFNEYKYGFRFFYWSQYKNNPDAFDPACSEFSKKSDITRCSNSGYKLGDFYIVKKHGNLKSELLCNKICALNAGSWDQLNIKAEYHKNTIYYRSYSCPRVQSAKFYDMSHGDKLTVEHLIAMMVYCNFTKLQCEFSKTYRRTSEYQTIEQIKAKHRNYWNLGRLLRELVECFGMKRFEGTLKVYHGATDQFCVDSLYAFIKTPFSTTTNYSVASHFAAQGIIMEMTIDSCSWIFRADEREATQRITCFDCTFVSDFVQEEEVFCIGGMHQFRFNTIIRTACSHNYIHYIRGVQHMTCGMSSAIGFDGYESSMPKTNEEMQMVFRLLSHQLHEYAPNHPHAHEFKSCPSYIRQLMDGHCKRVRHIDKTHKAFDYLFRDKKNGWINVHDITVIFPNAKIINWDGRSKDILSLLPKIYQSILSFIREDLNRNNPTRYVIRVDSKFETDIKHLNSLYSIAFKLLEWDIGYHIFDVYGGLKSHPVFGMDIEACRNNPALRKQWNENVKKNGHAHLFQQAEDKELDVLGVVENTQYLQLHIWKIGSN